MARFRNPGFYQRKHYADLHDAILDISSKFNIDLHPMIRREAKPSSSQFFVSAFLHWVELNLNKFLTHNFKEKELWGEVDRLYFTMSKVLQDHVK